MSNETQSTSQPSYCCEGFIKEVKIAEGGVTFTLEPAVPYLFEKKEDDGKTKKLLLLVDDSKTPHEARILDGDKEPRFSVSFAKCDLSAMLIAKANRLKIRVKSDLQPSLIPVKEIVIL